MNLNHVNLRLLRIFDAIYRERTVTAASMQLGLSQPAVSHALGNLRAIFNDELFVRTPAGMAPTVLAMSIGEKLPEALSHLENALFGDRFDPASTTRTFSIACSDYTGVILIPRLVARFRKAAPHASLKIVPREARLLEDLDSAKIDIIIAGLASAPHRMEYEELFEEELVLTSRRAHPLEGQSATIADVLPFGLVGIDFNLGKEAYDNGYFSRLGQLTLWNNTRVFEASNPQAGSSNLDIVVPNFHAALHILKSTDMFAEVPRRLVGLYTSELQSWDELSTYNGGTQCQLWHSVFGNQQSVVWLRQLVRDAVGDMRGA